MPHHKTTSKNFEARSTLPFELRSTDEENGIFEGYVTVWDTVDSYGTTFTKGCFAKSLQERFSKIKVLENHDTKAMPIGVPLEFKEDDKGLWCRAQLALGTERGRDMYELMKIGAVNTLSFGFSTVKSSKRSDGVIEIKEVILYEISPVNFEANPNATINGVRAMEQRSTQFSETLKDIELSEKGYVLKQALNWTMQDIWWSSDEVGKKIELMEQAIDDFKYEYIAWMKELEEVLGADEVRGMPGANALAQAMNEALEGRSCETFAANSTVTLNNVQSLRKGQLIDSGADLSSLPENVRQAYAEQQNEAAGALRKQLEALNEEQRSSILESFVGNDEVGHKEKLKQEQRSQLAEIGKALAALKSN